MGHSERNGVILRYTNKMIHHYGELTHLKELRQYCVLEHVVVQYRMDWFHSTVDVCLFQCFASRNTSVILVYFATKKWDGEGGNGERGFCNALSRDHKLAHVNSLRFTNYRM